MGGQFAACLTAALGSIRILPRRMLLETAEVHATVPMLRGVWGAALHGLDSEVYRRVFEPATDGLSTADSRAPGYILRPAPPDPEFAPALEWILIGDAIRYEPTLCRAWDIASGMGLGPQRRRFHIPETLFLTPSGAGAPLPQVWPLSHTAWPLPDPEVTPCHLVFSAPLRLRRQDRLIEAPTLADIVVAACRRVKMFLPTDQRAGWDAVARVALEHAQSVPAEPWQGERLDLHRFSARQQAELDLYGVSGTLELPCGPGDLWPLLAAAQWLHVGKGTVMGLGQLTVQSLD